MEHLKSFENAITSLDESQKKLFSRKAKFTALESAPGTGKTFLIAAYAAHLLREGVKPREILILTFSESAVKSLKKQILQFFPYDYGKANITTFHSFALTLLQQNYFLTDYKADFTLLTGYSEALLMSFICNNLNPESYPEFGKVITKRGFQKEVLTFIGHLKTNLVDPDFFESSAKKMTDVSKRHLDRCEEIASLYKLYEAEKLKMNSPDFRDCISIACNLLQRPEIASIYASHLKYIIVDDFQELDPAQLNLLKSLIKNAKDSKVVLAGSPREAIYRFRGALPDIMTSKHSFYKALNKSKLPLDKNHRCATNLLKAAENLPLKTPETASESIKQNPAKMTYNLYETELDEASGICRQIASMIIYGEEKTYKPSDFAILVKNNYQIDLIIENLEKYRLPYQVAGDMKFFRSEEVTTLASLFKIRSAEPSESDSSLLRAITSPIFGISERSLQQIFRKTEKAFGLYETLQKIANQAPESTEENEPDFSEEEKNAISTFAAATKKIMECGNDTRCLTETVVGILLPLIDDTTSLSFRYAFHFRDLIKGYIDVFESVNSRQPSIQELLDDLDDKLAYYASTLQEEGEEQKEALQIMTAHQAKGLEFPSVFICGLNDGIFPSEIRKSNLLPPKVINELFTEFSESDTEQEYHNPYSADAEDYEEEERRLFYMSATRAKEELHLSSAKRMNGEPAHPSPYLEEFRAFALPAAKIQTENLPLTLSELKTELSSMKADELEPLEELLNDADRRIPKEINVRGIKPVIYKVAEPTQIEMPENFIFSASSITNYLDCPRKFFFANILRISDPLEETVEIFALGNALHACLEELHDPKGGYDGKKPTPELLDALLQKHSSFFKELSHIERQNKKEELRKSLDNYVSAVYETRQLPTGNTLGTEMSFYFELEGLRFSGRFDRIIKDESGACIITDYKSSTTAISSEKLYESIFAEELQLSRNIQIPFYMLAAKNSINISCNRVSAGLIYPKQDLYKRKTKDMLPGYMRSGFLNLGFSPGFGKDISEIEFAAFEKKLLEIVKKISEDRLFLANPSAEKDARTCLNTDRFKNPQCPYFTFCQEHRELNPNE